MMATVGEPITAADKEVLLAERGFAPGDALDFAKFQLLLTPSEDEVDF
jgi:hypothetical protein